MALRTNGDSGCGIWTYDVALRQNGRREGRKGVREAPVVESSVKYVRHNALKGRVFASLELQNQFLLEWETSVANKRIHGTTKRQVAAAFALAQLPKTPLQNLDESSRLGIHARS